MHVEALFGDGSLRPVWPHADALITSECPGLRFAGKYADVVALSNGDPTALRPFVDEDTRRRVASMAPPRTDTAGTAAHRHGAGVRSQRIPRRAPDRPTHS